MTPEGAMAPSLPGSTLGGPSGGILDAGPRPLAPCIHLGMDPTVQSSPGWPNRATMRGAPAGCRGTRAVIINDGFQARRVDVDLDL
jgi:hypothetical protein